MSKIPATGSCRKDTRKSPYPEGKYQKSLKKIPPGILLPHNHRNCPEPAVFGLGCSIWAGAYSCKDVYNAKFEQMKYNTSTLKKK
jgi:hypothetical protein